MDLAWEHGLSEAANDGPEVGGVFEIWVIFWPTTPLLFPDVGCSTDAGGDERPDSQ